MQSNGLFPNSLSQCEHDSGLANSYAGLFSGLCRLLLFQSGLSEIPKSKIGTWTSERRSGHILTLACRKTEYRTTVSEGISNLAKAVSTF